MSRRGANAAGAAQKPLSAQALIERLRRAPPTVEVGGMLLELGQPDAATLRSLVAMAQEAREREAHTLQEGLEFNLALVRACVPGVESDDDALTLMTAAGNVSQSPLLTRCREVAGFESPDEIAEIEETGVGNS